MNKFIAYSCLATAIAYGAPDASYGGYGVGLAHGIAAPAIHAPATVTKTITRPKCTVTYEEIETQNCIPREEKDCTTEEVEQEYVEYERDCKETTSKECGPSRHLGIIKREAEASYGGYGYGGYGGYGTGIARGAGIYGRGIGAGLYGAGAIAHPAPVAAVHPAPVAVPKVKVQAVAKATSEVSIKSDCREVTKEICTNTPMKKTKKVPVTTCKPKKTVECKKVTKRIPNKQCEPVEHEITVPAPRPIVKAHIAPAPVAHAPITRGYGSYGGYGSFAHQW